MSFVSKKAQILGWSVWETKKTLIYFGVQQVFRLAYVGYLLGYSLGYSLDYNEVFSFPVSVIFFIESHRHSRLM